jgi:hypothetical protein
MINLFINYYHFINNFNYIYSIFYYLQIKIKIIKNNDDIIQFIQDEQDNHKKNNMNNININNEYIFYEIFDFELYNDVKLRFNINIYYFINKNYDINELHKKYEKTKYILISNNYYHLLNYKNEKILLLYQFDTNKEYTMNKIDKNDKNDNIFIFNNNDNNDRSLIQNNPKYELCDITNYENIKNSIIIFENDCINNEMIINILILNGNYILYKFENNLHNVFFYNLLIVYNKYEELNDKINDILQNISSYKLNYDNYIKYFKKKLLSHNQEVYEMIDKINNININFGFLILRHVNSIESNKLWYNSLKSIRKFYKNKIYIIDDNSNYDLIENPDDNQFIDITVIHSIYHNRGEILPYYYLYCNKLFDRCLIIHDSVFINRYIDFDKYTEDIHYLWHFDHKCNNLKDENTMMKILDNPKIIEKYDEKKWNGCFGVQTLISYRFVEKLKNTYNIFSLLNYIDNRSKRMNFERVFAVLCSLLKNDLYENYEKYSIYGDIHDYIEWEYSYKKYLQDNMNDGLNNYKLIKVWSGR